MSVPAILYIVTICVLFLFSGFFSGTDMAFSSVNVRRLKAAMDGGSKTAKLAYRYATDYDNTIITILFGNNLVNILASSLAAVLCLEYPFSENPMWESLIPALMLVLLLIFGEIIPKAIARAYNYRVCMMSAYIVRFFEIIFFPFARGVNAFATLLTRPLSKKAKTVEPQVASDEEPASDGRRHRGRRHHRRIPKRIDFQFHRIQGYLRLRSDDPARPHHRPRDRRQHRRIHFAEGRVPLFAPPGIRRKHGPHPRLCAGQVLAKGHPQRQAGFPFAI